MGEFDDDGSSLSLASLLCQEQQEGFCCFNENGDGGDCDCDYGYDPCFVLESGDVEYIEELVQREIGFGSRNHASYCNCSNTSYHDWLKCARSDATEWILNTRAVLGFQFQTAYLSVTYFDRFLAKRSIDEGELWAIQLLSVACLSIAAKMEECIVPPLSEFPVKDYCFKNKVIQRMELLVLSTLEWKMGSITPFTYLQYFINKIFSESRPKDISRGVELIVSIMKEVNLLDHQPSIIAAAAALAAFNSQLTRKELELKMNVLSSWGSLEKEEILSCYIVMQEIEMRKLKTPKLVISPNTSSMQSGSMDVVNTNSRFNPGAGIKRRLAFNDSDQNCPAKKICQSP